jgi:hypothetical protein
MVGKWMQVMRRIRGLIVEFMRKIVQHCQAPE